MPIFFSYTNKICDSVTGKSNVVVRHGCLLLLLLNKTARRFKKIKDRRIGRDEITPSLLASREEGRLRNTKKRDHTPSSAQMFWSEADLSQERRGFASEPWSTSVPQDEALHYLENRLLFSAESDVSSQEH